MFWQNLESDENLDSLLGGSDMSRHVPIMVNEVLSLLEVAPNKNFLDLTAGGGGHAHAILQATAPSGMWFGSDRDEHALARAKNKVAEYGARAQFFHGTFRESVSRPNLPWEKMHGVLIDCGVSSDQLDTADRGFSFQGAGPLDMRMDTSRGAPVSAWLARAREEEIANVIFEFGEERYSRRIAKAIVSERKVEKLLRTDQLAEIIFHAVPAAYRHGKIHPATRSFQALRIFINEELVELSDALNWLARKLPAHARIAVLTFHSLEDRIVKQAFLRFKQGELGRLVTRKPMEASEIEVARNPRARSAKLRVFELLGAKK